MAQTRRRGEELEDALLAAAWEELKEGGYQGFTMEAVAERARTGRQVLYRRWPNKKDLVIAAISRYFDTNTVETPDTGTLRGDLIAYLVSASTARLELIAVFTVALAEYFDDSGESPADLRAQVLAGRRRGTDVIFERAAARGEVEPSRLTPRMVALPFDLLRSELMMTRRPVPEQTIVEIVDDVVLPAVTSGAPARLSSP
ncbi:TetR/AcrR family transcriptional regulator [Cryptosporangium phraense]|uniref:TetR/AcrR family transcriptional regulator n=1 Tax=Cryptosporangium phraense TaxID=2593070 RepID=A0A545AM98_9ACTN|nr:TetR/AcrR family transcriptional regulator [Cryptosporangium phraense]TQS42391.1 TetR/AcrR family transcriptional regulator [Cryptosporangium phraense]